jgi:hypothetical protein
VGALAAVIAMTEPSVLLRFVNLSRKYGDGGVKIRRAAEMVTGYDEVATTVVPSNSSITRLKAVAYEAGGVPAKVTTVPALDVVK